MEQELQADIVVIGGGSAGIIAATAAARSGADVLLVDRYGFIGGTGTIIHSLASFLDDKGRAVIGGLAEEFVREVAKLGGTDGHRLDPILNSTTPMDVEIFKYVAMDMPRRAGVRFLLHTWLVNASVREGVVESITVLNKSGMQSIRAKTFIDCSGDGDLAASAGAPYEKGNADKKLQPLTMTFRMANFDRERFVSYLIEHPEELRIEEWPSNLVKDDLIKDAGFAFFAGFEGLVKRVYNETGYKLPRNRVHFYCLPRPGFVQLNISRVTGKDATDAQQLTDAEIEGRYQVMEISRFLIRHVPGFEDSYLLDTPVQIGVRETRRIMGEYVLTREDILDQRQFPDVIGQGIYPVDIHHPSGVGSTLIQPSAAYQIPYRILTPQQLENVLIAGRCVSATHDALAAIRVIASCMMMGQAAGTAAGMTSGSNDHGRVKQVRIRDLQDKLVRDGAILPPM